jgi:hypothetical protein
MKRAPGWGYEVVADSLPTIEPLQTEREWPPSYSNGMNCGPPGVAQIVAHIFLDSVICDEIIVLLGCYAASISS